jgi:hypothetical protein
MSIPNNSTIVYNGTATITMRQGNMPIFGTVEKLVKVEK